MGYYMMKPSSDDDFYVEWSTFTDTPIAYGSRVEFQSEDPEKYSDDRFERLDRLGTSSYIRDGEWGQETFWLGQSWEISRDKLRPFLTEAFDIKDFDYWDSRELCQGVIAKYCTPLEFED